MLEKRRQLPSAATLPPPRHPPPTPPRSKPSPPLSIISIWCGQPVCVVLISSNKSVIIAVLSPLSPPPSLFLCRSFSDPHLPLSAAVFPFVQREGVLRGAHAILRSRDCVRAGLSAFSQDRVPGPQGKHNVVTRVNAQTHKRRRAKMTPIWLS